MSLHTRTTRSSRFHVLVNVNSFIVEVVTMFSEKVYRLQKTSSCISRNATRMFQTDDMFATFNAKARLYGCLIFYDGRRSRRRRLCAPCATVETRFSTRAIGVCTATYGRFRCLDINTYHTPHENTSNHKFTDMLLCLENNNLVLFRCFQCVFIF